jgi:hypothetical protein
MTELTYCAQEAPDFIPKMVTICGPDARLIVV